MESIMFASDDNKFLQQTLVFCNNIDDYISPLDLDFEDVQAFKEEVKILLSFASKYPSFSPSFIRHNILDLRLQLASIAKACQNSVHYNRNIGRQLGFDAGLLERHDYAATLREWFAPGISSPEQGQAYLTQNKSL